MSLALVCKHVQVNDITVNLCHVQRHLDVANKDNKEGKVRFLMTMSPLEFVLTLASLSHPTEHGQSLQKSKSDAW